MVGWKRILAIFIGVSVWCSGLKAQQFKVSGVVRDAHSQEIIPFATLQFVRTQTGMVSNAEGKYLFELNVIPSDSLLVRVMGYDILKMPVNKD